MSKRIAIIIERANTALGGAERSICELATALSELDWQVHILAAKGQEDAENVHILYKDGPGKRACYFMFARALSKHLSANRYDIIHSVLPFDFADVYQPRGGTYAESIVRNAASYQNKFMESYKNLTAFANYRRTILLRAERKLCKQPSGPIIIALSRYVADQLRHHYGTSPERIIVIPNGIETDREVDRPTAEKLRGRILTQSGLKGQTDPALFLFVANNFRYKGLAAAIKAMHSVRTRHDTKRDSLLIVAGAGKKRKYNRLTNKLSLGNRIIFLGPTSDIQSLLSVIDVAVLPSFCDASSRFTLEAIAGGKPVITTKFNGATDLFINNRHGKVIDAPEDIRALADAISYFTDADNIRKAAEAIAQDNLKEQISVRRVAKQLTSVYESILQRKGRT